MYFFDALDQQLKQLQKSYFLKKVFKFDIIDILTGMNNRIFHIFHKILAEVLCIQLLPVLLDNILFIIQYSQYISQFNFITLSNILEI